MASIPVLYEHLISNYKFQTACYVVYVYDHFLTFSDEVDKIWSQKFNFTTLLFYINRYVTHCQFIILQTEFYETDWPISVCVRYVKFAGATTMCLVVVADAIMIIRVYALYFGNKYVLGFLLCFLIAQIIICGWSVHYGVRVPLPDIFPGCVLTGDNSFFASIWAAPLATDTAIFSLTVLRCIAMSLNRVRGASTRILDVIIRDGIAYFFVIFSANLMNCLIYFLAVEDLKAMGASFSQIITAIMIARLQLNLKKAYSSQSPADSATLTTGHHGSLLVFRNLVQPAVSTVPTATDTFFTVGNLGAEMEGIGHSVEDHDDDNTGWDDNSSELELRTITRQTSDTITYSDRCPRVHRD